MSMRKFVAPILGALLALSIAGCDQTAPSKGIEEQKVGAISQAEAETIVSKLNVLDSYDPSQPFEITSEDATLVLSLVDLKAVLRSCYTPDIRGAVLVVEPSLLDMATGTYDYPYYMMVDDGASGDGFPPSHQEAISQFNAVSDADIFHDWLSQRYFDESYSGEFPERRLKDVDARAFDALDEAVLAPLKAKSSTVSVETTDTILVTFKTPFGWGNLNPAPEPIEWTSRYKVEKRGNKWVIVSMVNFTDYAVAQVEAHLAAASARPSDKELEEASGKDAEVEWVGQDNQKRWYAAFKRGRGTWLMRRDAASKWSSVGNESIDGGYWVGGAAPKEVIAQMEKAGLGVYE